MKNRFFIAACALLILPLLAVAQFNASLRGEYQIGNKPQTEPGNRANLYNQLKASYRSSDITVALRLESFYVDEPAEYQRLSQYYLRYTQDNWRLQAGHFYEILGRGLLLRGYEVPGTTFEDNASRQRYAFYKDIEGLSLRYQGELLNLKLLSGRPLDFSIPPARKKEIRRASLVHGGEANLNLVSWLTPGVLFLREDTDGEVKEYAGANISGFAGSSQYYLEYVQDMDPENALLSFGKSSAHAFYGSVSQTLGSLASLTLEYKDYNEFNLVFNEAPQLVRQHSYTLLNRATHSVEPANERGYQAELLLNVGDGHFITLNNAYAENKFGSTSIYFREIYADLNYYFSPFRIGKIFFDFSEEDLFSIKDRYTGGVAYEQPLNDLWSVTTEVQHQFFKRDYGDNPNNHSAQNQLFSLGLNRAPDFSVSVISERSNDPLLNNRLGKSKKFDFWNALIVRYTHDQQHELALFYGKRRGGNACTGGICYEVLPFEGVELSWNTRL